MKKTCSAVLPAVTAVYLVFFFATANYPFFWDTVQLASKHATWFYQTGFKSLLLPAEIDSGHFPATGLYLAAAWKLLGRSLLVSHIIMLPFVLGIIYQVHILVKKVFSEQWQPAALILLLSCPALIAQCTLVSPDVFAVFFFLTALNNGIFGTNKKLFAVALVCLSMMSLRGMMYTGALLISDVLIKLREKKTAGILPDGANLLLKTIIPYIPALIFSAAFLLWHYIKAGWTGYHSESPWYPSFEPAGINGMMRNILILIWRLADFGQIFVLLVGALCLRHFLRHSVKADNYLIKLSISLITLFIFTSLPFVYYKNLSGHRYLLPVFLLMILTITYYLFEKTESGFPKKVFAIIIVAGLITGNLWVYPDTISQGWDASLAYLPYPPLRNKMMKYMEKEGIPICETGSGFPNLSVIDFIDLNGNMLAFTEKNLNANRYVFWSNVFNDFSDSEIEELKSRWIKIKELRHLNVKVILYKNPLALTEE